MSVFRVENLSVILRQQQKTLVKQINFHVDKGECLAIVGESGSGKSMAAKAMLGLLGKEFQVLGSLWYNEQDFLRMPIRKKRGILGKKITLVLQNPMTAFDPLMRIGEQMAETLFDKRKSSRQEYALFVSQLLKKVNICNSEDVLKKYPHQLSGGMLQRIMIALAFALEPDVIIADEPTTAIDAVSQKEVIGYLREIKAIGKTAIVFISHDLAVVASIGDKLLLMQEGRILENKEMKVFMEGPESHYGKSLLYCKEIMTKKALSMYEAYEKRSGEHAS